MVREVEREQTERTKTAFSMSVCSCQMRFIGFYRFAAGRMSRRMQAMELVSVASRPEVAAGPVALV